MLNLEIGRRQRRLTQHALAKLARVDQAFISMVERGEGLPTPDQLERLATALRVAPPEWLLLTAAVPTEPIEEQAAP